MTDLPARARVVVVGGGIIGTSVAYHLARREYDQAVEKVTAALQGEGFGILTEIDVKTTLKKKLDVDFRSGKRA